MDSKFVGARKTPAVRMLRWMLKAFMGLPHFSESYLSRHIERPGTGSEELQEYKPLINGARFRWALIISSLAFLACTFSFPIVMLSELNFRSPVQNIKPLGGTGTGSYQFSCLVSNCSRLSSSSSGGGSKSVESTQSNDFINERQQLAADYLALPLFAICHRTLSSFQGRIQFLAPAGLLLSTVTSITVLLCGLVLPLAQAHIKSGNLLVMFLVAPRVTCRVVYDRVQELYELLRSSCSNFDLNMNHQVVGDNSYLVHDHLTRHQSFIVHRKLGNFSSCYLPAPTNKQHDCTMQDCLSLMRSRWWLERASRLISNMLIGAIIFRIMSVVVFYQIMLTVLRNQTQHLVNIDQTIRAQNCSIWVEETAHELHLEHFDFGSSRIKSVIYGIQSMLPLVCLDMCLLVYLITNTELLCWLYEILFQLHLATEYSRQLLISDHHQLISKRSGEQNRKRRLPSLVFEEWRSLFSRLIEIRVNFLVSVGKLGTNSRATNSRLESTQAIEFYVTQSISHHQLDAGAAIEILEKLYVSFRVFVEHVRHYDRTMTLMTSFINLYTYGLVASAVWYIRKIDGHSIWPLVVLVFCWAFANFIIQVASNFHAKAKRLHVLIWSLLAVVTCKQSSKSHRYQKTTRATAQLEHISCLWLKQVEALDRDGGLALRAFGVRVTYIRIIQLIVGSGTAMVFALRD